MLTVGKQKPELTKIDEKLKNSRRKLVSAEDNLVQAQKERERQVNTSALDIFITC